MTSSTVTCQSTLTLSLRRDADRLARLDRRSAARRPRRLPRHPAAGRCCCWTTAASSAWSPTTKKRGATGRTSRSLVLTISTVAWPTSVSAVTPRALMRQVVRLSGSSTLTVAWPFASVRTAGVPVGSVREAPPHRRRTPRPAAAAALGLGRHRQVDAVDRERQAAGRVHAQAALAPERAHHVRPGSSASDSTDRSTRLSASSALHRFALAVGDRDVVGHRLARLVVLIGRLVGRQRDGQISFSVVSIGSWT